MAGAGRGFLGRCRGSRGPSGRVMTEGPNVIDLPLQSGWVP